MLCNSVVEAEHIFFKQITVLTAHNSTAAQLYFSERHGPTCT